MHTKSQELGNQEKLTCQSSGNFVGEELSNITFHTNQIRFFNADIFLFDMFFLLQSISAGADLACSIASFAAHCAIDRESI